MAKASSSKQTRTQAKADAGQEIILSVQGIAKTFFTGFLPYQWAGELAAQVRAMRKIAKRVDAVRDLSFEVRSGEIFGLLGPNGAGKTTTLKMVVGLLKPDRGKIRIFGQDNRRPDSRRQIGFLPENPYFYDYLRPQEFLGLAARLTGLSRSQRKERIPELLDMVGLTHAVDRPLKKFSKGMLQRVGLAQALIADPKFVILDEPMTGLDPVGRKEIRDLIAGLADQGKTVLFSSHILSDVEMLCSRVAILAQGRLRSTGLLDDLMGGRVEETEVVIEGLGDQASALLEEFGSLKQTGNRVLVTLPEGQDPTVLLKRAIDAGGRIVSVTPRRKSLEEIFMAQTQGARTGDAPHAERTGTPPRRAADSSGQELHNDSNAGKNQGASAPTNADNEQDRGAQGAQSENETDRGSDHDA